MRIYMTGSSPPQPNASFIIVKILLTMKFLENRDGSFRIVHTDIVNEAALARHFGKEGTNTFRMLAFSDHQTT